MRYGVSIRRIAIDAPSDPEGHTTWDVDAAEEALDALAHQLLQYAERGWVQ